MSEQKEETKFIGAPVTEGLWEYLRKYTKDKDMAVAGYLRNLIKRDLGVDAYGNRDRSSSDSRQNDSNG